MIKCPNCSTLFSPTRSWQRFCSNKCQTQHWHKSQQLVLDPTPYLSTDEPTGIWRASVPEQYRDQPFAYGWERKQKFLYIGSTSGSQFRFHNHHIINKILPVVSTDHLHLWLADEPKELEFFLINTHIPPFNRVIPHYTPNPSLIVPSPIILPLSLPLCPYCHEPFRPSGGGDWRLFCSPYCHGMFHLSERNPLIK